MDPVFNSSILRFALKHSLANTQPLRLQLGQYLSSVPASHDYFVGFVVRVELEFVQWIQDVRSMEEILVDLAIVTT